MRSIFPSNKTNTKPEIHTLIISSSEENGPGLIPNEALGDSGLAEVLRHRSAFLQHRVWTDDLGDEGVAAGSGLELAHLDEHGLSEGRLRIALLGRRSRFVGRRRHGYRVQKP